MDNKIKMSFDDACHLAFLSVQMGKMDNALAIMADISEQVDAMAAELKKYKHEACLYYHADGTSEQLGSPEEVKTRRIKAAKQIEWLTRACKAAGIDIPTEILS